MALSVLLPPEMVSPSLLIAGSACSVIPDLDVIGFSFGVKYSDMLGHRGLTHSLFFAVALAAATTAIVFYANAGNHVVIFLFLFLSTLSHSMLDALTNGGLGVGFFAPFSNKRYFFPYRPIKVSPIGIAGLFSYRGVGALLSELKWVWLPSLTFFAAGQLLKRMRDAV